MRLNSANRAGPLNIHLSSDTTCLEQSPFPTLHHPQTARIKEEIAADCVACHESALAAAAGKARTMSEESAALVRSLQRVIETLQHGLVERDTEVRLMLLAALAQEHILLIGPPGTAKSELGRRLARLFDGVFFERLLTRFSVPEELFGPLSMKALERDEYRRQTESCVEST